MSFLKKRGTLVATILAASAPLLLNSTPAFALSQGDLVSGGSIWLETTIAVAMVFVTAMAFSLQIARGYFLRTLEKFTLRLGADIWWLAYVLIRDALIFMSFVMGLMVFFPGTFQDYDIAVPFMPLSVVFFGAALVTKLYFDADEDRRIFRLVTVLVFAGTISWIFGTVFVTETPLALGTLPSGVSASSGFWYTMYNTFSSRANVDLSMLTFNVTFPMLGVIGVFGLAHPLLHSRIAKSTPKISSSTQGPVSPASLPGRSVPARSEARGQRPSTASGSAQASTPPSREGVDYIQ